MTCAHHWILSSTEIVPLRGRQAAANPGCVGRPSKCKKCGLEKILPERTEFTIESIDDDEAEEW